MVLNTTLAMLPDIEGLRKLSQSLAMLDAIMSPEWDYRYYSFNSKWSPSEMMASMRNGSGDDYFIRFDSHGAIIKGFDHESTMSPWASDPPSVWPGVLDQVPGEFQSFLDEPAFSMEATTFCIWRRFVDESWRVGRIDHPEERDPDGSVWLLSVLDGQASSYQEFAESYYERPVPVSGIEHIYRHEPLTKEVVAQLNSEVTLELLAADIEEIGYPTGAV